MLSQPFNTGPAAVKRVEGRQAVSVVYDGGALGVSCNFALALDGGWLSTGAQTISGTKTFPDGVVAGSVSLVDGGKVSRATRTLQPANASFPGGVSTGAQDFSGNNSFQGDLSLVGPLDAGGLYT